ncbi:MAG: helix-turn-helix domain-containing protein [Clostridiales bacterium]|jgi:transcriptional regulator with XRE-family HTH domain|nr:helix-turn-helix domain-containing protein [Clostridiales bacterium]
MPSFASRLRELRLTKNMKQTDLAVLLNCNVKTIQRYESGFSEANFTTLFSLSDYFNVSLDYLVGRSDVKEEKR